MFYKVKFWDYLKLDQVNNQKIANELFDTSVNMGQGIAALFLQRSLNVSNRNGKDYPDLQLDGAIGPVTINALNNHPRQEQVLKLLNTLQGARYISICEANPSQEIFMTSWLSRVG
jgi:lysozyme family protein